MALSVVSGILGGLVRAIGPFFLRLFGSFGVWLMGGVKWLFITLFAWIVERSFHFFMSMGVFGFIFIGVDVFLNRFVSEIMSSWGGLSGDIYQILMLCGVGTAFNILISCIGFAFSMNLANRISSKRGTA